VWSRLHGLRRCGHGFDAHGSGGVTSPFVHLLESESRVLTLAPSFR
jgi:hypothetical protein